MMRTLVVGDTHADAQFVSNINRYARDNDVEAIVQLGDFGYGFNEHANVMASIQAWLDRDESHTWYWVDGNHDNHDKLREMVGPGEDRDLIQFQHDRCFYVPRGVVFQLGDTTCMGMGGAVSVDKAMRRPHVSWWPFEEITQMDIHVAAKAIDEGADVDVMFTHDGPASDSLESRLSGAGYKVDHHSYANRMNLTRVVDFVRPQRLYHGHYHERYQATYTTPDGWDVQVEGVGANLVRRFSGQVVDHNVRIGDNVLVEDF